MICRYTGTMLIYRNSLLIIYKQNSLKSQEKIKTKYVSVRPKIKFYLFPLIRPTLKKGPYPKDFISIFRQEFFFFNFIDNLLIKLRLSNVNSVIFKKNILSGKLFVYLMLLPKVGLFTFKFNGYRTWEVK